MISSIALLHKHKAAVAPYYLFTILHSCHIELAQAIFIQLYVAEVVQVRNIQYNTIQYNTIQYNTIQYNTIQYSFILS